MFHNLNHCSYAAVMPKLLLIPLEDTVVFPGMEVTLPVDPGDESQVLLVPRHESDYATVGVVAEVGERMRLPGRIRAVQLSALHRGIAGAAESDPQGRLWVEVEERPDEIPPPSKTRELESEYRADGRGDPRAARRRRPRVGLRPLDRRAGRPCRHVRVRARPHVRAEGRAAPDRRRRRAAEPGARAAARPPGRAPDPKAHPRGRRVRRPEAAARVSAAPPDGLDPQGAGRGRRVRRRGVPHQDRRGRDARRRARAGRARARPARADGRAVRRVLDDPHVPRLADRRAVVEALRGAARSRACARGARRRPRRPRRRQGAHHRVPGRAQAARRARASPTTAARASS